MNPPPVGTIVWAGSDDSGRHWDHIHIEPPTKGTGTPALKKPPLTPGLVVIRADLIVAGSEYGGAFLCRTGQGDDAAGIIGLDDWRYGTYSRRPIYGTDRWSQHAYNNAQDYGPLLGADAQWPVVNWLRNGVVPKIKEDDMGLKRGDAGPAVSKFQGALNTVDRTLGAGKNQLKVDGKYGSKVETAVMSYQKAAGLVRTGQIDGLTGALLCEWTPDRVPAQK